MNYAPRGACLGRRDIVSLHLKASQSAWDFLINDRDGDTRADPDGRQPQDWFEGRGAPCTLIVLIDDATDLLTSLRCVPAETTRAYLETLRAHVLSRTASAFSGSTSRDAEGGDGKTEFGRVSERLGVELIHGQRYTYHDHPLRIDGGEP